MSAKPVFVATHPRACSTAFERVFMTRRETLQTVHEPFGDAFYYGPERMSVRFEGNEKARTESGFANSTYKTILDRIERESEEGKRVFVKDMAMYWVPPQQQEAHIAPCLQTAKRGVGTVSGTTTADSGVSMNGTSKAPFPYETRAEAGNPTILPRSLLEKYHWTFLIRHPNRAIPSYYRCCIPPLVEKTQFDPFMPCEAGYDELRRFFDYCKDTGLIGPKVCGQGKDATADTNGASSEENIEICLIDADDLLDDPEGVLKQYCASIGVPFEREMLTWDSEESHAFAKEQFEKWNGFHEDAINSKDLRPREHKHVVKTSEQEYPGWVKKYGKEAADIILKTVEANVADYEYLKQFAIKI
ncbi:Hypothetical protein R9X50_00625600 [Acrodontium crateriforme]|uniref:P-loop containing nucleoside triphosphate hydrolase protein n=1 Tax=Acrodontium crateriforme TaxID=150365 RepID=A0AAQ3MD44_9PEZI|nr:Hypothetical protein R9X50_00625600 [Acrodontium crateriforme]